MRTRCLPLLSGFLLGLLALPLLPVRADDANRTPTAVLLRRLSKAGVVEAGRILATLRARGTDVLPGLQAHLRECEDLRLVRLEQRILADHHLANLPDGMVYIPAGDVVLPRTREPWGPSEKRVHVPAFYIDRTETCVAEWRAWIAWLDREGDSYDARELLRNLDADEPGELPVRSVSHVAAERYARTYRQGALPTRHQFLRAMRGAGIARWPWGSGDVDGRANLAGFGAGRPEPVGSRPGGASPYGVLDLVGNVAEWLSDRRPGGRALRSYRPVVGGGSFRHAPRDQVAWLGVDRWDPRGNDDRRHWIGFRVVKPVPEPPAPRAGR